MRLSYYVFPDDTPEEILLQNGCGVVVCSEEDINNEDADTWTIYPESISEERRPQVRYINHEINRNVSTIKKLMKTYGGYGYTMHIDRDGSVFETSEITLKGNNSKFKYNHHL